MRAEALLLATLLALPLSVSPVVAQPVPEDLHGCWRSEGDDPDVMVFCFYEAEALTTRVIDGTRDVALDATWALVGDRLTVTGPVSSDFAAEIVTIDCRIVVVPGASLELGDCISGGAATPFVRTFTREPDPPPPDLAEALMGCWARLPWPEREARVAADPTVVWDQQVCFGDDSEMMITIMEGGGQYTDEQGNPQIHGIDGWSWGGAYRIEGSKVEIDSPDTTWVVDGYPRAACEARFAGDVVTFANCTAWETDPADGVAASDSRFRRTGWGMEDTQ